MTTPSRQFKARTGEILPDSLRTIVCHCLHITRDEIEESIETASVGSLMCVIRETGAGSGCTACHCTIRSLLEAAGHSAPCQPPQDRHIAGEQIQMVG
ncbi:MAG: (2Fe-2S)-binding protein [Planctomycetaceae bacterium]